jgi:hypothetical protein
MCSDKSSQTSDGAPQSVELDDRIRARAYGLWKAEGSPEGRAEEYWHRARELIEDEAQSGYPPAQSRGHRT